MSSPGVVKDTRPEPPVQRTTAEMETNDLSKSTLTDESHKEKVDTKTCLFSGLRQYFSPIRSRDHLGVGNRLIDGCVY